MLPKGLKEQLGENANYGFVIGRDVFSKCLVLYAKETWKDVTKQLSGLNRFVEKNVQFLRRFSSGATAVSLDNQGRLMIPGHLVEFANMSKDLLITSIGDRMEVWDKKTYNDFMDVKVDMGELSEQVMGQQGNMLAGDE